MAIAVSERIPASTQDPLWWRLVTDPLWKNMRGRLSFPLDAGIKAEQERAAGENKALHKLARERDLLILSLGLAAIATIAGLAGKDQISSAVQGLTGGDKPPVTAPHPGLVPDKGLDRPVPIATATPTSTEIRPTPKPEILTPTLAPTEAPTLVPTPAIPGPAEFSVNGVTLIRQLDANGGYVWTDGTNKMVWEPVMNKPVIRSESTDGSMVFEADGNLGGWYVDVKGMTKTQVSQLLKDWAASYKLSQVDGVKIGDIKGVEIMFGLNDYKACDGAEPLLGSSMCVFPPHVDEKGVLYLRLNWAVLGWDTGGNRMAGSQMTIMFAASGALLSKGGNLTSQDQFAVGNKLDKYVLGELSATMNRMGKGK